MTQQNDFAMLLQDFIVVLADADSENVLAKAVIPKGMHEQKPELIVPSYQKFIKEKPDAAKSSISEKLEGSAYSKPYDFYHDLTIACAAEIALHQVGSEIYQEIDQFHKYATELLLREVGAQNIRFGKKRAISQNSVDEALSSFKEDFDKISSNNSVANGEMLTFINKYEEPIAPSYHSMYTSQSAPETKTVTQPLFSGLVGKSVLDTRNTLVPDPYNLSKVVNSGITSVNTNTMKSFTSPISRVPPLSQSATQILDSFFHPNWYTLEAPKWLTYKQKTLKPPVESTLVKNYNANELRVFEKKSNAVSFAPTTDLRNSVVSDDLKTSVWFSNVGFDKIHDITRKHLASNKPAGEEPKDTGDVVAEPNVETSELKEETTTDAFEIAAADGSKNEIKLENLARFTPEALKLLELLKKERDSFTSSPRDLQKLVSVNLLKLNKLRQERYLHSTAPGNPTAMEITLYKKIMRLLTLLLESAKSAGTALPHGLSKRVLILFNEYQGVLPGPVPSKSFPPRSGRLPGMRGPYKKKHRFM